MRKAKHQRSAKKKAEQAARTARNKAAQAARHAVRHPKDV